MARPHLLSSINLMESPVCNLCGGESAVHWLTGIDRVTGQSFDVVQCRRCELRYTNPRPSPDEMAQYYPAAADGVGWTQCIKRWLRRRRAEWSAAGLPPGRALEVGCGDGWMLCTLQRAGWEVVGTERCLASAVRPQRLGLDVRVGDLAGCGLTAQSFDLVILWHVLEHLHDPLGTLIEVRRVMRPSGRLVIAVPNVDSWQASVAGRRWFHLDVPRHLYHFAPETLRAMLAHAGFRVQAWSFSSPAYECRGWWELLTASFGAGTAARALAALTVPFVFFLSAITGCRKRSAALTVHAAPVELGNKRAGRKM